MQLGRHDRNCFSGSTLLRMQERLIHRAAWLAGEGVYFSECLRRAAFISEKEPRLPINNFRCAAGGGRHDICAAGHGFDHGQGERFGPLAGEEEDAGFVIKIGRKAFPGNFAQKSDLA